MSELLAANAVTVHFGGLTAIDNVSASFERGEICGVIGPNGAGKSTFFNLLSGLIRPSRGQLAFEGVDIWSSTADRRAMLGIRRPFQSVQLIPRMTVLENVLV